MTDYEIKLPSELVSSLMSEGNGFAQLLTGVLNQITSVFCCKFED